MSTALVCVVAFIGPDAEASADVPALKAPALEAEARERLAAGSARETLALLERAAQAYAGDRSGLARVEVLRAGASRALAQVAPARHHASRARSLAAAARPRDRSPS